jgi:hypothetical protein
MTIAEVKKPGSWDEEQREIYILNAKAAINDILHRNTSLLNMESNDLTMLLLSLDFLRNPLQDWCEM